MSLKAHIGHNRRICYKMLQRKRNLRIVEQCQSKGGEIIKSARIANATKKPFKEAPEETYA